ncbi:MAG: DegV family protein [Acutalibacteraceae bacterium]|nr:DegV family protein [Acutalibacteraceae bacterium]
MSFEIYTDTASNLGKKDANKYNLHLIHLPYFVNGKECTYTDLDSFDDKLYYYGLKNGIEVKTSQINPEKYIESFKKQLDEGKDILFIGLSSGVSGSFNSARIAKEELAQQYPDRKIVLFDSLGASLGIGLLVLRAVEYRNKGLSLEETAEKLKDHRERMYQIFIVDDLSHLHRTGRLSGAGKIIGTALGIRPVLKGSAEGKIVVQSKVRGRLGAIKTLADKCINMITDKSVIGISYANCLDDAKRLIGLIKEKISVDNILLVKHEPSTGSHLGSGALALYFEGHKGVRDC